MLPSSAPLNVPEIAKVGPKDTAGAGYVKPPGGFPTIGRGLPSRRLSLAIGPKIRINAPSVDSGRELNGRSSNFTFGDFMRQPVCPSSRFASEHIESFPKG
jgi:hypothetical protein